MGFDLIHRSLVEKPVDIFAAIPLPFDDELKENESELSDWQLYTLAKDAGYFSSPLN